MPDPQAKEARISQEVRAVGVLSLEQLRREWRRRWDGDPPRFRSRDLLSRAMAYRLQAEAFGDLKPAVRRRIKELTKFFLKDRDYRPTPGPEFKPGTALVREWHGIRHEVVVSADGFIYQGETFRSLSQVANTITGGKWNGYVFFGLKSRGG